MNLWYFLCVLKTNVVLAPLWSTAVYLSIVMPKYYFPFVTNGKWVILVSQNLGTLQYLTEVNPPQVFVDEKKKVLEQIRKYLMNYQLNTL